MDKRAENTIKILRNGVENNYITADEEKYALQQLSAFLSSYPDYKFLV